MNGSLLRAGVPLALFAMVALGACGRGEGTGPGLARGENPDGTVFLAQDRPPEAVMEALYVGRVNRDAQGCLRVEAEGGATVIWPYGFRLQARDGGLFVQDANGRTVGRIGERFRMGGGYVPSIAAAHLSDADRTLAEGRCASANYWVVGETD